MKNFLLILSIILLITPVYAQTLEGGIRKIETPQQAQEYIFKYIPLKTIDPTPYKAYATKAPEGYKVDISDGSYTIASGNKIYRYKNNLLTDIGISDKKNIMEFPRKLSYYEYPSGKLTNITYGSSPIDGFIFRPDGSLVGIWENGIYREGNRTVNTGKTSYF